MRETMAKEEEPKHSPQNPKTEDEDRSNALFSPGFRSVAAMAGWDEEALLIASLVVEDTPDRNSEYKKRTGPSINTPPSNTRRKRIAQRRSPAAIPVAALDLDHVECEKTESVGIAESKAGNDESMAKSGDDEPQAIPCIDKLREELSCAICLEICFEPSTTLCGHSFCKKCLRSAADKCGKKCPKCRQLISNGRSCTVNTVLWNTIQLLFPKEIEARKASGAGSEAGKQTPARTHHHCSRNRTAPVLITLGPENQSLQSVRRRTERPSDFVSVRPRRELPRQDEDAALALRLQRQEFLGVFGDSEEEGRGSRSSVSNYFRVSEEQRRNSLAVARANLRAMASRATSYRTRSRAT